MQATIVVLGTYKDGYASIFEEYSRKVRTFLEGQEAVVLRRQLIRSTLYGSARPNLIMLIDFLSAAAAETAFFRQEYLDLIPLRDKVFVDFQMYLAAYGL